MVAALLGQRNAGHCAYCYLLVAGDGGDLDPLESQLADDGLIDIYARLEADQLLPWLTASVEEVHRIEVVEHRAGPSVRPSGKGLHYGERHREHRTRPKPTKRSASAH